MKQSSNLLNGGSHQNLSFQRWSKKKKTELCVFIHSSIPRSSEDYHAVLIETKFLTLPSDMLMSHEEKIIKEENT